MRFGSRSANATTFESAAGLAVEPAAGRSQRGRSRLGRRILGTWCATATRHVTAGWPGTVGTGCRRRPPDAVTCQTSPLSGQSRWDGAGRCSDSPRPVPATQTVWEPSGSVYPPWPRDFPSSSAIRPEHQYLCSREYWGCVIIEGGPTFL